MEKILQQQDEILKRIKVLEKREQERDQLEKPAEINTVPASILVSKTYLGVFTEINPPPPKKNYDKVGFLHLFFWGDNNVFTFRYPPPNSY